MKFGLPEYHPQDKVISSFSFSRKKKEKEMEMSRGRTVLVFFLLHLTSAELSLVDDPRNAASKSGIPELMKQNAYQRQGAN